MDQLSKFLTKNPVIVVAMFFFTFFATVAGLLVSWDVLYKDYLSHTVTIPIWLTLLVAFAIFFGWILYGTRRRKLKDAPLELIADKLFGVERVLTSGKKFVSCKFNGTEIVIDGQAKIGFESCSFINSRFTFAGAAAQTMAVLSGMYRDPSFQPMIDETFQNVKSGDFSISPSPSGKRER
ncbi:hypothetical protein TX23_01370 [Pseudomonas paralactis]|uniref:Uncharacterized protein n=1 Tax=Pseudomonas paralactis TaxID=1615673 RepID=A0A0R3ART3_9PSED|nr:hypothetical protein [Pseudomonas paralactis]KRP74860.1 hypothetical protein TX23_01370 [Pseudomonas paralactis]